jgi:hypothetical protein
MRVYFYRRISRHWGIAFGIPVPLSKSAAFWVGFCAVPITLWLYALWQSTKH